MRLKLSAIVAALALTPVAALAADAVAKCCDMPCCADGPADCCDDKVKAAEHDGH